MVDWSNYKFVLDWVKENLCEYQFTTPEAEQLRTEMENTPLNTEGDIAKFGGLYEQFLMMVERNPFTMYNVQGKSAAILVNDFYYYIYPTAQDMLVPLGVQIEIGAIDTPEKASALKVRIEKSAEYWKEGYRRVKQSQKKFLEVVGQEADYRLPLESASSPSAAVIRLILLLLMTMLCIGGNIWLCVLRSYEIMSQLSLLAFGMVTVVSIGYFVRTLLWIFREKKRQAYVAAWKEAKEAENDKDAQRIGFRNPETFPQILESIENQQYKKTEDSVLSDWARTEREKKVDLTDLNQKKVRNKLYTSGATHIVAMLTVILCFCLYATELFPESLAETKNMITDQITDKVILPYYNGLPKEKAVKALDRMQLRLVARNDDTQVYKDKTSDDFDRYPKDSDFLFLGYDTLDEGTLVYQCRELNNSNAPVVYVEPKNVLLRDDKQIPYPSKLEVVDKNGKVKPQCDARLLFDGCPETYVEFEAGDVIRMKFETKVKLRNAYILNGKIEQENHGIRKANMIFGGKNSYAFLLPEETSWNGYLIPLSGKKYKTLEIEILSVNETENSCAVSELILCN